MGKDAEHGSKRKAEEGSDEINWTNEEWERVRAKKQRREEAEPFNTPEARRRARKVGMKEARLLSDTSRKSNKRYPRGLLTEDDSSCQAISAIQEPEQENIHTLRDVEKSKANDGKVQPNAATAFRERKNKRKKRQRKEDETPDPAMKPANEHQNIEQSQPALNATPGKSKGALKRARKRARRRTQAAALVEAQA